MTTKTSLPADRTALHLRSTVKSGGELELSLVRLPIPTPEENEVLIRVDATPINPSDQGLLFAGADMSAATFSGSGESSVVKARVSEGALRAMAMRVDVPMPVGNEGAGLVVEAGSSAAAQALLGKTVAALGGGAMYAQYRCVAVDQCLALPEGATAVQGASSFINPLTALGMVETLKTEGHKALVHTAAASSLGQMLQRICTKDGIDLINVVRKAEQEEILRAIGATYILNSSSPTFAQDLTDAMAKTGATLAFDATGGGKMPNLLLSCMEAALGRDVKTFARYGTFTHKQVYIYGGLEVGPTELTRSYGMSWGVGGWLVTPFLMKIGPAAAQALKRRVAAELTTTFATQYAKQISLIEALSETAITGYGKRATGEKYLIVPNG